MTENNAANDMQETQSDVAVEGVPQRPYGIVFFDLDGTLLPIDTKAFMNAYMASIGRFMAEHGLDEEKARKTIFAGAMAMGQNTEAVANRDAFWNVFCSHMGKTPEEWEPLFMDYYLNRFDEVGAALSIEANPASAEAIRTLKRKGYRLAVTTMPMFPEVAVEARLRWAGLSADDFEFLTTYESSTSVKPYASYYAEALERAGVAGDETLMVGNHNREDGGATELGCDIYFVTDHLIEVEDGIDVASCKHGTMRDFLAFCEGLPDADCK